MYIRGKPWVIIIDDYLLYDFSGNSLFADSKWGFWAAAYKKLGLKFWEHF